MIYAEFREHTSGKKPKAPESLITLEKIMKVLVGLGIRGESGRVILELERLPTTEDEIVELEEKIARTYYVGYRKGGKVNLKKKFGHLYYSAYGGSCAKPGADVVGSIIALSVLG